MLLVDEAIADAGQGSFFHPASIPSLTYALNVSTAGEERGNPGKALWTDLLIIQITWAHLNEDQIYFPLCQEVKQGLFLPHLSLPNHFSQRFGILICQAREAYPFLNLGGIRGVNIIQLQTVRMVLGRFLKRIQNCFYSQMKNGGNDNGRLKKNMFRNTNSCSSHVKIEKYLPFQFYQKIT